MVYLPELGAMSGAENVSHVMHNVMTLRGAKVRDALRWSNYLDDAIARATDAKVEVLFASHHWPTWGKDEIVEYLEKQRDRDSLAAPRAPVWKRPEIFRISRLLLAPILHFRIETIAEDA